MALESRTSPALDESTMTTIADHSSSDLMLLLGFAQYLWFDSAGFGGTALGNLRTARDPPYAATDQNDSCPAIGRNVLMQKKMGEYCYQQVSHGGRAQHVTQVGPLERGQVSPKKTNQECDSSHHPGIPQRADYTQ